MDCLLISYRQKDDPLNAIIAGGITGGILSIRGGTTVAFKQCLIGGFILTIIEGVSLIFQAHAARQQHMMMEEMQKQEMARVRAMMSRGGENPWEVGYKEDQEKGMQKIDDEAQLKEGESAGGGVVDKATKSFSF